MNKWRGIAFTCLTWLAAEGQEFTMLKVELNGEPLPMAEVSGKDVRALTNYEGEASFALQEADTLTIAHFSAEPLKLYIEPGEKRTISLSERSDKYLDQVVVTASRSHLDRRESPIAVQVVNAELLSATQSISVAEGLSFRPGLRVEYNCQNCGFSQVRLNGLDGPYSQILIDGRPVFSALSGVYGLEQLPASMIERVEIVRGGGSSLYGANAIAGTINLITKEPTANTWEVNTQSTWLGGTTPDHALQGQAAWVTDRSGFQLWTALRDRAPFNANPDALYDRNGDGITETKDDFSEITQLKSAILGGRFWTRPSSRERIQIETRGLYEFRRGGNRFEYEPHEADIAEQLIHKSVGLNGQYEWMSENGLSRWSVYGASTYTDRSSYYGAGGNSPDPAERERAKNYYGATQDIVANTGVLYAWGWSEFHSIISGLDFQYNQVQDAMPGYYRQIDQTVFTPAVFAQYQWKANEKWTFQVGGRYDSPFIESNNSYGGEELFMQSTRYSTFNPRISTLYKAHKNLRFRASYASGFRAPQAFDEDLHLSTLGGTVRIVQLDPNLQVEQSDSWNLGIEWETPVGKWEGRWSVDGFYTLLNNPFVNQPFTGFMVVDGDTLATLDTKVNDPDGASVTGVNLETEWVSPKWTVQAGWTFQSATYRTVREWYPQQFSNKLLRAPQSYGYAIVGYIPQEHWKLNVSGNFTGSMVTPNERLGTLVETPFFTDVNASIEKTWDIKNAHFKVEAGVYNILNSYQEDVEVGWNRDASYFYGPLKPRSFYISLTLSKL